MVTGSETLPEISVTRKTTVVRPELPTFRRSMQLPPKRWKTRSEPLVIMLTLIQSMAVRVVKLTTPRLSTLASPSKGAQ